MNGQTDELTINLLKERATELINVQPRKKWIEINVDQINDDKQNNKLTTFVAKMEVRCPGKTNPTLA